MPSKKVTIPEFRKMDMKVAALEGEMSEVKSTLMEVQNVVKANHETLMAMFEKCLNKSIGDDEGSANKPLKKTSEESPGGSNLNNLKGDVLTEFRQSIKKVELPAFNGEDPAGWISRAEVYFKVHDTSPELKVNLAQLCMEGATIHFFNSLIGEDECMTWTQLKEALLNRYGGHGDGDVYEQLTDLKQDGTVEEYINEFEYLTAQIPKLPDKQFLGYFLHGLNSDIRGRVRSLAAMGDMSRARLLQVTRAVEKEVKGRAGSIFNKSSRFGNGSSRPGSQPTGRSSSDWVMVKGKDHGPSGGARKNGIGPRGDSAAQNDRNRHVSRDRGFSRLTYPEILEMKQKGLCFKCKKTFRPNASVY
jgi:hypothetical protein